MSLATKKMVDEGVTVAGTPPAPPKSSRIIIKNLPSKRFTDEDLKKHISKFLKVTDCRVFPERRIAFVGFSSSDNAERAVKHFNKSYIRTSKLDVQIARPVKDQQTTRNGSRVTSKSELFLQHDVASGSTHSLKRKRHEDSVVVEAGKANDVKLQEYLNVMHAPSNTKTWANDIPLVEQVSAPPVIPEDPLESDGEYDVLPKSAKTVQNEHKNNRHDTREDQPSLSLTQNDVQSSASNPEGMEMDKGQFIPEDSQATSDTDWLRSRTNRILDLMPNDQLERSVVPEEAPVPKEDGARHNDDISGDVFMPDAHTIEPVKPEALRDTAQKQLDTQQILQTGRLFLRNLFYSVTEEDIRGLFEGYGSLTEVHLPLDHRTSQRKGFAYVHFREPSDAVEAYQILDQTIFQGRTLHILPSEQKREHKLNDFTLSQLPLKKQREILKRRAASTSGFEWNSLYMSIDAVMSSMAERLGIDKAALLDPTSSDAIVRQAHAETHVIQETKTYFEDQGIDLGSFNQKERGNRSILIKNFPFGTQVEELKSLLEQYGKVERILMPPAGIIAIALFVDETEGRAAFSGLYGRKFKDSVLKVEKGPKDLFVKKITPDGSTSTSAIVSHGRQSRPSVKDLKELVDEPAVIQTTSLFVKNLNFNTTNEGLRVHFQDLDGFVLARLKSKLDPKNPGQTLSMGYGFVEFRTKEEATIAMKVMNGKELDGHKLEIKGSHKGDDLAAERRKADLDKREASKGTKMIIKNLAFEVTEKQVRQLLGQYGKLRSVRLPKKFNKSTRGFGFAEFVSVREAESAMHALKHTHLHGRPLVLQWANEDAKDSEEEILRLQEKVGKQVNSVRNAQLTGAAGRKKFDLLAPNAENDME